LEKCVGVVVVSRGALRSFGQCAAVNGGAGAGAQTAAGGGRGGGAPERRK